MSSPDGPEKAPDVPEMGPTEVGRVPETEVLSEVAAADPAGTAPTPAAPGTSPGTAAVAVAAVPPVAVAPTPMSVVSTDPRSSERSSRGKRAKAPFRLCFTVPGVPGRSVLNGLACSPANTVAGKFYSREEEKIMAELQRVLDLERDAAGEEAAPGWRGRDLLESFRYGQYPRPLVVRALADRRLHFARRTSEMVRVQCQIARAASTTSGTASHHGPRGRQAAPQPQQQHQQQQHQAAATVPI